MFKQRHEIIIADMSIPNSAVIGGHNSTYMSYLVLTVLTKRLVHVSQPQDDNTCTGLVVGVLIGGVAIGAVTVLLVVGIVCGVCKLRQHPKQPTSEEPDNK